ncbi:hypothetical protein [Sphingobium sp.]|uniref:hypothetical protein n=1 Tax=Sphingobium sp. TaxID=1912891 RepID=UPI0035C6EC69
MGLLDGGIEAIFGTAFGGLFLPGTLHRDGTEPIFDAEGNITGYEGGEGIPCRLQIDGATYAMRQSDGYVDGDVRIIILSAGLGVEVTTDMQVTGRGQRWMIASAERDAAASHWICRGRKAD